MNLQRLSIRQVNAYIGMETQRGELKIESPPGDLQIQSPQAEMSVDKEKKGLQIDSSSAWMALGKGDHLQWYKMVSNQMEQQFLLNLTRIVEEGNRLIKFKHNTIADMVVNRVQEKPIIEYLGEPSFNNVQMGYTPDHMEIDWKIHEANIQYTPQKPEINFQQGLVNIYMKQKNSIQMWVSNYDIYS